MSDLLQNYMSISHAIRAHAQEVRDISDKKIKGGCQSGRKVVTHNSKSDLPLCYWVGIWFKIHHNNWEKRQLKYDVG